ncbi:hypothetical protein [Christiangramia aquimixticola]|uniref:hypothetical protein n=1 Tax=Christiangramia aquimixticola TaxID=1697558 RepID=UPI003AA812AA
MELNKIKELLTRFENGETSREEEKLLLEYFKSDNVPASLVHYKSLFSYIDNQRRITASKEFHLPREKPKYNYAWTSIAAVILVAIGLFFYSENPFRSLSKNDLGTISDKELALQKTKETLKMVSSYMNEGKADLVYLKEFNKTASKIIEIDKTRNHE